MNQCAFSWDHRDVTAILLAYRHGATLTLLGQYSAQDFTLASDGNGGTIVTDPPDRLHPPSLVGSAASPVFATQT